MLAAGADNVPCDDGNPCMQVDGCKSGSCTGASPLPCDDKNACTADACNVFNKTCVHVVLQGCQ